jgi:predicted RND superfamily exporter protein
MKKSSTKIKIFSLTVLGVFTFLSIVATYFAAHVPTNYAMDQFLPRKHPLLTWDWESKKLFHITIGSPHILLLSLKPEDKGHWYDENHLIRLEKLTHEIETVKSVDQVISLGNIQTAFEKKNALLVAPLPELRKEGFKAENILRDPLYTPALISKDGRDTAIFINAGKTTTQDEHTFIMKQALSFSKKEFPSAKAQLGGPAAIRNQLITLLGHEVLLFIFLALVCAVCVLKVMFRGYWVLAEVVYLLIVANTLAVGVMGFLKIPFNVLTSTVPVLVTVSSLGICTHLLVRMSEAADRSWSERAKFLHDLIKEIAVTIIATGLSTSVGFACLIKSDVPIISGYGLAVSIGVCASCTAMLFMVPSLYLWVKWPEPRPFLYEPKRFARFLSDYAKLITPAMAVFTIAIGMCGQKLDWTARLFDDLPANHSARRTTDLVSKRLGGVANVDVVIGSDKVADAWKQPENIKKLDEVARELRRMRDVGSVISLADFMTTGEGKMSLPKSRKAIAEIQFLYSMSGESPLKQFLSDNEKWTRLAIRLPDLPADVNQRVVAELKHRVEARFPHMQVKTAGFGAIVPPMNAQISRELMWGFFEALFWIVLMMSILFRSVKWAVVGVVPNLVPPAVLLGFLALFHVDIKPGIAIIFSITLGIAFDNTIYILGRLKSILKENPDVKGLPIYELMKRETMPCLVSSMCLFAGFTVFVFSVFPINQLFGLFVLVAIVAGLLGDLVWMPAILKCFPWLLLESEEHVTIKKFRYNFREAFLKLSPYLILLGLGAIAFHSNFSAATEATSAKRSVDSILKEVEHKGAPPDERALLKMIITESDGSKKDRVLTILRKNKGEARALIRLSQPSDLKGLSLLSVAAKDGKEDQWLYLPSDKKSRRILGSNKKGKFLDSEISYEDLRISTYKDFKNRIVKEDGKMIQIESIAKPDSDSSYGKVMTWITDPDYHIMRVDYYDKGGKLLKRAEFKNYTKVGDKFWRARVMSVVNAQTKRATVMTLQNVSVKQIRDDEISLAALEE